MQASRCSLPDDFHDTYTTMLISRCLFRDAYFTVLIARCLLYDRQVRPEIVIKGALKYEGESTAWREYEVSGCAIHGAAACYGRG